MKNLFFFVACLYSLSIFGQIIIEGTVKIDQKPIDGVAIYFNNTMMGTTSNKKGKFSIKVKEGTYELIVSYLGYQKINYALKTANYKKPLVFNLQEETNVLDEVIIKKTIYNNEWKYNLETFKKEFIGISDISKNCKILNPKVLHFEFDPKNNRLEAFARKPLKIKHKDLGYEIIYELESFVRNKNYVTYLGYSRYKELKGGKRKKRRWQKNRLKTYNGSAVHFYKSLIDNKIDEEGYIVHQFKRLENKERPSEKAIKKARQLIKLSSQFIHLSKKIENPKTPLDSALLVSRKARLPKFKDYLYKSKLKKEEIISIINKNTVLTFKDNLSIIYTKEKEEKTYITRNMFRKTREPLFQTSSIIPLKRNSILDKSGVLVNPLDVFYEGYWSYEKFANSLPLDYKPE